MLKNYKSISFIVIRNNNIRFRIVLKENNIYKCIKNIVLSIQFLQITISCVPYYGN